MDLKLVEELKAELIQRKKTLSLAESCTGGAIAALITKLPGASQFFLGSLVVYANEWKENFLNISTIDRFGAVSKETVVEMAKHLLEQGGSDFVAAVSGIAGPSGGSAEKPIGTVWIAVGEKGKVVDAYLLQINGTREKIIETATEKTIQKLLKKIRHDLPTH